MPSPTTAGTHLPTSMEEKESLRTGHSASPRGGGATQIQGGRLSWGSPRMELDAEGKWVSCDSAHAFHTVARLGGTTEDSTGPEEAHGAGVSKAPGSPPHPDQAVRRLSWADPRKCRDPTGERNISLQGWGVLRGGTRRGAPPREAAVSLLDPQQPPTLELVSGLPRD